MSAVTPTAGPWSAEFSDTGIYVTGPDHNAPVICDVVPRDADAFTDEDEANANLIAAAPDLLEAAREAYIALPRTKHNESINAALVAAIAKAGGDA